MSKRSDLKRLSSVSQENLIRATIRNFDTWPVLPSGILVKPSSRDFDTKKVSDQGMKSFERSMNYFNNFIQVKSTIMLFFFSALIGISGNLLITVLFSNSLIIDNLTLSLSILISMFILVIIGIKYVPKYSMNYIIQGDYEEFPKGYESYINLEKIENPIMKTYIDLDYFPNFITKYSIFVRSCILKDYIVNALKEKKFIKIEKIIHSYDHYPSFSISFTTNLYAILRPGNDDEIKSEFMSLNGAITMGKIACGVMAYELDENEWKKNGTQFLNEISHINLDEALSQITDEIKTAVSSHRKWRKKIEKILCPH